MPCLARPGMAHQAAIPSSANDSGRKTPGRELGLKACVLCLFRCERSCCRLLGAATYLGIMSLGAAAMKPPRRPHSHRWRDFDGAVLAGLDGIGGNKGGVCARPATV